MKQRVERKYRTKVIPRDFKVNDLVLRRAHLTEVEHKLSPKWIRPFRIKEVLHGGAYRVETLDGAAIPRTWNASNLRFYFIYSLFLFFRHVILSSNKPHTLFPYLIGGFFNKVGVKLIYKPSSSLEFR